MSGEDAEVDTGRGGGEAAMAAGRLPSPPSRSGGAGGKEEGPASAEFGMRSAECLKNAQGKSQDEGRAATSPLPSPPEAAERGARGGGAARKCKRQKAEGRMKVRAD